MGGFLVIGGGIAGQAVCEAVRELDQHTPLTLVCGEPGEDGAGDQPLLQLILTTHSPVVVASLNADEGVFFDSTTSLDGDGSPGDVVTRARIVRQEFQQTLDPDDVGELVTHGEVQRYLATVGRE